MIINACVLEGAQEDEKGRGCRAGGGRREEQQEEEGEKW